MRWQHKSSTLVSVGACSHTAAHLCVRRPDHSEVPEDLDQGHLGLQQGKTHTNAVTRTHSKWHEAEWVPLGLLLSSEPAQAQQRYKDRNNSATWQAVSFCSYQSVADSTALTLTCWDQTCLALASTLGCSGGSRWGYPLQGSWGRWTASQWCPPSTHDWSCRCIQKNDFMPRNKRKRWIHSA